MIGASALELPHGPVLPWQEPAKAARAFFHDPSGVGKGRSRSWGAMARIEPFMASPIPAYVGKVIRAPLDLIPTPTLLVPISGEDETILAQMTPKGRYNIKLAQKKGVEVGWSVDETALEDFYYLFELTFHRHDFAGEPSSFFQNMLQALKSDHGIRVYHARYRECFLLRR